MDELPFAQQNAVHRISDAPTDLTHPWPVGLCGDARDFNLACGQIEKEENHKPLQPSSGPFFHREEIRRYDQLPVAGKELFPAGFPAPLRCGLEPIPCEDRRDGAAGDRVPQVGESTLDPPIAPSPVPFRPANHQGFDLTGHARAPGWFCCI